MLNMFTFMKELAFNFINIVFINLNLISYIYINIISPKSMS